MIKPFLASALLAANVVFAAGSRSAQVSQVRPMTTGQLQVLFSRAQDPRRFWITVYGSEEGPFFANANRLHPGQQVALLFEGGKKVPPRPVISVEGTGRPLRALLDTSSRDCWAAPEVILGLRGVPLGPPAYPSVPEHVEENMQGYACLIPMLRCDQMQMENVVIHLRAAYGPLGRLARRDEKKTAPVLVLGMSWIQAFSFVQINYPEELLFLSATSAYAPSADHLIAEIPLKTVRGALAVDGVVNGEPRTLILDSAGDFEVAMSEPPAEPVRVSIGDLVFPRAQAASGREHALGLPAYPRIGAMWLSKYKVTIAPKAKKVYFERP